MAEAQLDPRKVSITLQQFMGTDDFLAQPYGVRYAIRELSVSFESALNANDQKTISTLLPEILEILEYNIQ